MRISHSSLSIYLECPYKWFLHYMRKLRPVAEKSSLAFGSAMDEGLNILLLTRNIDEAINTFNLKWSEFKDKEITYSKSDLEDFLVEDDPGNSWLSLYRKGVILLKEFDEQIMPRIKEVIKIQIDQTVKNEDGDELVIKTDFICKWEDDRIILFDNKQAV